MQDPDAKKADKTPRKRRRRKEARPAEIVDAAMDLWAERGFAATRLDDVAAGAGIAKGTIYLYFPSKEALFEGALEMRLVATIDRAAGDLAGFEGTTEEMLRRFLSLVYAQIFDGGAAVLLKVLISEGHRFPALVRTYEAVAITRGMTAIRAILARGVARGELRAGAEDTDPRLIMSPAVMGAIWNLVFSKSAPMNPAPLMEKHIDLVLNGLRPR